MKLLEDTATRVLCNKTIIAAIAERNRRNLLKSAESHLSLRRRADDGRATTEDNTSLTGAAEAGSRE